MKFRTILLEKGHPIATLTFNRPQRLNAMNDRWLQEMPLALEEVAQDPEIRVLIVTGAGRAFNSGGDLKGDEDADRIFSETRGETIRQIQRQFQLVILKLQGLGIPVIAMVNGVAAGAGFDLALACDLRIGSEKARFKVGYTQIGLIPGSGGTWLLPRVVGLPKATELLFTDRSVEAEEALKIGLLNWLVPAPDLEKETLKLAQHLASQPPLALKLIKLHLQRGLQMDLAAALDFIASTQPILITSEDHKEGIAAFRERRKGVFKGR